MNLNMSFQRGITSSAAGSSAAAEVEHRRARGQLSCAECRRLKLRCDKKVPCSSCKRRHCEQICPNGVLKTVNDSKQEKTRHRLSVMSKRIHQLEIALQAECARNASSPSTHDLLKDDLLAIKNDVFLYHQPDENSCHDRAIASGPDTHEEEAEEQEEQEREENIVNCLGMLTISEGGESSFVGQLGYQQVVLTTEERHKYARGALLLHPEKAGLSQRPFPDELKHPRDMWPFVPPPSTSPEHLQDLIEAQLPEFERACLLADIFLMSYSWSYRPVDRGQIFNELIPRAYPSRELSTTSEHLEAGKTHKRLEPHDLALLFTIFCCGARNDFIPSEENWEVMQYYDLACAALGLKSVLHTTSLATVQAISLLSILEITMKNDPEASWKLMSLALASAVSVGLRECDGVTVRTFKPLSLFDEDRDPARWKLGTKFIERRRSLFWEVYTNCSWVCLSSGRPMLFSPEVADCEFPLDGDSRSAEDGSTIPGFSRWRYTYVKDVVIHIIQRVCTSQPLKYSDIMDLDQRVQTFAKLPGPYPNVITSEDLPQKNPSDILQWICTLIFKDMALLYIHRALFARALLDYPHNPLRSPFAPSFLAAYRSATTLLKVIRENFDKHPVLFARTWLLWTHAFASSIIVGSVVSRIPTSELAAGAFFELGHAIEVFKKALSHPVAKGGLPILQRVYDKAYRALHERRSVTSLTPDDPSRGSAADGADHDDELDLLRGVARMVLKKKKDVSPGRNPEPLTSDLHSHSKSNCPQMPTHQLPTAVYERIPQNPVLLGTEVAARNQLPLHQHNLINEYCHQPGSVTGSEQDHLQTFGAPWSFFQNNLPTLAEVEGTAAQLDMNIDVSDMNFDLSSLLASETPPLPTAASTPNPNSFGVLPPTPPPLPSFTAQEQAMSASSSFPGDELMEAWRSMYSGVEHPAHPAQILTGSHGVPRNWLYHGFANAGTS